MKKVYMKPVSQKFELELQGIVAASEVGISGVADEQYEKGCDASSRKKWGSLW